MSKTNELSGPMKKLFGLEPVSTALPFKDMHGKDVLPGTKIRIVSTYGAYTERGVEATVIWDQEHGMYKYTYTENRRGKDFTTTNNFYGVAKFEIINPTPTKEANE